VSIVDKIKEHRNNVPKELEGIDELDSTTKDYMLYKFLKDNLNDYPYLLEDLPVFFMEEILKDRIHTYGFEGYFTDNVIKKLNEGNSALGIDLISYVEYADLVPKLITEKNPIPYDFFNKKENTVNLTSKYLALIQSRYGKNKLISFLNSFNDRNSCENLYEVMSDTNFFKNALFDDDDIIELVKGNFGKNLNNDSFSKLISKMSSLDNPNKYMNLLLDNNIYDRCKKDISVSYLTRLLFEKDVSLISDININNLSNMELDIMNSFIDEFNAENGFYTQKTSDFINKILLNKDNKIVSTLFVKTIFKELLKQQADLIYKFPLIENYPGNIEDIFDDDFILNNDDFILNSIDKIANVSNPSFIKKIFEIIVHRYPEKIFQIIGMGKYTDIIDSIIDEKIIRSIISNKDMFNMLFLHANDGSVEKIFHSRAFRNVIDNDKELTFGIMYFINLYDVHNEYIDHLNKNFAMIQNVRPELSWFNSSFKKELLEDEVINVLGVDYLNIVLNFDTIATDAVIRAYNNHNLYELKEYTDFIVSITKNIRDINKSIGFFDRVSVLYNDIKDKDLNIYQKELFLEIAKTGNINNVKNYEELNNYFDFKASRVYKNQDITEVDFNRLFLNRNGMLDNYFNIFGYTREDFEYLKYKYLDTGVISEKEFLYLLDVYKLHDEIFNQNKDIPLWDVLNNWPYKDIISIDTIFAKLDKAWADERKGMLTSPDELRRAALEGKANIEYVDGVEVITLMGCDYKFVISSMRAKKESNEIYNGNTISDGVAYVFPKIAGEKLKSKYGKDFAKQSNYEILANNPEAWYEIEGVSTISSSTDMPELPIGNRFDYGYAWGSGTDIKICGVDAGDAGVSHDPRSSGYIGRGRFNTKKKEFYKKTRYLNEIWEDRFCPDLVDGKIKRVKPEFIKNVNNLPKSVRYAKFFGCPVIAVDKSYYHNFEEQKFLTLTKSVLEDSDMSKFGEYIYSPVSSATTEEMVQQVVHALQMNCYAGKITEYDLFKKLTDVKWTVYEEFGKSSVLFKELENECSKYMGMQEEVLDGNRAR
jgi:hypothetical protein